MNRPTDNCPNIRLDATVDRVPLVARFARHGAHIPRLGYLIYDPVTEMSTVGPGEPTAVWATQSLITKAEGDITSDESTDR